MKLPEQIWDLKYRYKTKNETPIDKTVDDTWRRVAKGIAQNEVHKEKWEEEFYNILKDYKFLPGGRIIANAGTTRKKATFFNCFVSGEIKDSIESIFDAVKNSALTQRMGGGIGFDFSNLRPRGAYVKGVEAQSSGPISFMEVFNATCSTISSAGQRRGAQLAALRCDHPDIESFIDSKRNNTSLTNFNLSVAITDKFMDAVKNNKDWDLVFEGKVYETIKAQYLWDKIMKSTYDFAEPGVLFVDTINNHNNLQYCEEIRTTNPCGEQVLPYHNSCLLGSINLTQFVKDKFTDSVSIDYKGIKKTITTAVRMLDNVIDISNFPLPEYKKETLDKRRMGIGITGLADVFAFCKIKYGSDNSATLAETIMKTITESAYSASVELAKEKGAFQDFDREKYVESKFLKDALSPKTIKEIEKYGIRNSHLTSIAPTGTISLYAGNVSSGLEPIFAYSYNRKILIDDKETTQEVVDYAVQEYRSMFNTVELPKYFTTTNDVTPKQHIKIQAILQRYVDSSISKTINVSENCSFDDFQDIYMTAWDNNLKGCTTFRPNPKRQGILTAKPNSVFPVVNKVARPDRLPCDIHQFQAGGEYWVAFVSLLEGRPYEVFAGHYSEDYITLPKQYDNAYIIKKKFKHKSRYTLELNNGDISVNDVLKYFPGADALYGAQTRLISMGLRVGLPAKEIMEQLHKTDCKDFTHFNKGMARVLKHYINDGEVADGICEKCNGKLIYQSGCSVCMDCGYSKCN